MEMRRCKDVVFGYSVCDVSTQLSPVWSSSISRRKTHAKAPTAVTLSSVLCEKIAIAPMHNTY